MGKSETAIKTKLAIGDRAVVTSDVDGTRREVWVRDIADLSFAGGRKYRVDDGRREDTDISTSNSWGWSGWVKPNQLVKIDSND